MSLFLEEDEDDVIEADEWAKVVADPRERQRAELAKKVAEFERKGGVIKEFECGETAIPTTQCLWSFPVGKAAEPDPAKREAAESRRTRAQTAAQKRGTSAIRGCKLSDDEMIVIIDQQLGVAANKKALREALGCSDNLMQRLLFAHFHDDPRADPYRAMSRLDHERHQVDQIRKLISEGHTGISNITKLMGLKNRIMVMKLDTKYGLKIPRAEPGYKNQIACTNTLCHNRVKPTARYCSLCGTVTAHGLGSKVEKDRC